MKFHLVRTENKLNVEHRTSNVERPMWSRFRLRLRLRPDRSLSLY